jgi:hypothetical protein
MASQKKYKGTVVIELKPCQYLETLRDIIFFNFPFCSAKGLCNSLRKAMHDQKSALIKHHPAKYPRIVWSPPLSEFVMVCNYVRNTPWCNHEEKTTIQAYHKLAWQVECPTLEVDKLYTIVKVMKIMAHQCASDWGEPGTKKGPGCLWTQLSNYQAYPS